jgi:hypothetical protein
MAAEKKEKAKIERADKLKAIELVDLNTTQSALAALEL